MNDKDLWKVLYLTFGPNWNTELESREQGSYGAYPPGELIIGVRKANYLKVFIAEKKLHRANNIVPQESYLTHVFREAMGIRHGV